MYYKIFIKNCIKNNYKNKTSFDKSLIKKFKKYRNNFFQNSIKAKFEKNIYKHDDTYKKLKKIYNFKSQKKQSMRILNYYKKFEINLVLKSKYDYKYKKLTNRETNYNSYIYLGLMVYSCKSLNIYHKLNCILKILDKISVEEVNFKILNYKLFVKLLELENKLLKKIGI